MSPLQEKNLIEACLRNDRQAQFEMYGFFSVRLMPLCKRYARSNWDADDILQEGFIKAFRYLKDFKSNGSFEGWLRRIMVTTALNFYKRKKITFTEAELNYLPDEEVHEMSVITNMYYDDLEKLVNDVLDVQGFGAFTKEPTSNQQADTMELINDIESIIHGTTGFEIDLFDGLLCEYFALARKCGVNLKILYKFYVAKNVLNQFRQDHGYKEGTYKKTWNGKEDNVVMLSFLEGDDAPTIKALYEKLEKAYAKA